MANTDSSAGVLSVISVTIAAGSAARRQKEADDDDGAGLRRALNTLAAMVPD